MKYEVVIWWSEEDAAYLAEVPELPGCMADGKTHAELLANLETVVDLWMAAAQRQGHQIPEPKGRLRYA
jgi:predicted RNase H-like HicB family nuclease